MESSPRTSSTTTTSHTGSSITLRQSSDGEILHVVPVKLVEIIPTKKKTKGPKPKNWHPKQPKLKNGPVVATREVPRLCYQQVLEAKVLHTRANSPLHAGATAPRHTCTPRNRDPSPKRGLKQTSFIRLDKIPSYKVPARRVSSLHDDEVTSTLETLMARYGRGTSSSFLDATYRIYIQEDKTAAVCFKTYNGVAVMYGDPLCSAEQMGSVFGAFRTFCKQQGRKLAVVGGGPSLTAHAKAKGWKSVEFATEQALNPQTNAILDETGGKTICRVNRRLHKEGVRLHIYDPAANGVDVELQAQLLALYDDWRAGQSQRNRAVSYSAVIDPFAVLAVSRYLYTVGADGKPNSFAGLIQLGAKKGALLEPCIADPSAPRNITDFLTTMAMGLLREEGVSYMTFGIEALPELGEITGMPFADLSRRLYRTTFDALGLDGRRQFHEKFKPDEEQRSALYMLFPPGLPRLSVTRAVLDVTHVSTREVWRRSRALKKVTVA